MIDEDQALLEAAQGTVRECQRRLRELSDEARSLYQRQLQEWDRYTGQPFDHNAQRSEPGGMGRGKRRAIQFTGRAVEDPLLPDGHMELAERLYRVRRTAQLIGRASRRLQKEGEGLQPAANGALSVWDDEDRQGELQDRILEAHEQERLRLAREIHDGPAQILANAIFELEYFERLLHRDPKSLDAHLAQLKNDVRAGLAEVRRFIFGLRPPPLSDAGLFAALHRFLQDFGDHFGIAVEVELPETRDRLPGTKEVALFRIVQEAVQNTQKHANARKIAVRAEMDASTLLMTIEDDGRGFDLREAAARHSKNLGLISMRERAELIDAQLQITATPGHGTRIALVVPLDGGAAKPSLGGL